VRFKIAVHSGHGAPPDAIARLAQALGSRRDDAHFTASASEIDATWGDEAPVSMERDEREELGREALLRIVEEVCEVAADLRFDWYAVSARRDRRGSARRSRRVRSNIRRSAPISGP
jgi:hypothetical protein